MFASKIATISYDICSMYGAVTCIWVTFQANVGKCSVQPICVCVCYPLVHSHNYGKSTFFMGKLTIFMAIFKCQRVDSPRQWLLNRSSNTIPSGPWVPRLVRLPSHFLCRLRQPHQICGDWRRQLLTLPTCRIICM